MRKLLGMARTRIGWAVIGAAATRALGGVATAAVVTSPATDEVSDVAPVTTETAEPTAESDPEAVVVETTPEAPAVTTGAPAPAATVEDVTEPTSTTAPEPPANEPPQNSELPARFTDVDGTVYQPAPEVPVEKLPGEPGYVPPAG